MDIYRRKLKNNKRRKLVKIMKKLQDIKSKERILKFTTTGSYHEFQLLVEEDIDLEKTDISQIFEENLTLMLDNGFSDEEIFTNTGMYIPTAEELQELEEFNEFFHVDKNYIVNGLLTSIGGIHRCINICS